MNDSVKEFFDNVRLQIVCRWLWAMDKDNHKDCKTNCLTCEHFNECFLDSH